MLSKLHAIFDALTDRERRIFNVALLIFGTSAFLSGTYFFQTGTTLTPVEGGGYREGIVGQPVTLNPLLARGRETDEDLIEPLFASLTELSENYSVSDDYKTWTVNLKSGLLWSDGEPLVSDDVIFTINAIQNPETESPQRSTWQGVVPERLSERSVRFSLKTPYVFFADSLHGLKIVPYHIFADIPLSNLRLSTYNFEPVGSGPYMFVRYDKRRDGFITGYHLVANEHYSGPAPLIRNFSFVFFQNTKEAISAFNRREIDAVGGMTSEELAAIKVAHQTFALTLPRYYAIFFNPTSAPALKSRAVRMALEKAVDRSRIIETALSGRAVPAFGPVPPGGEGYRLDLYAGRTTSETEAAVKLLDQDGFTLNPEGVRTKKIAGEEVALDFEIVIPDIPFLVQTVSTIKDDWQKIGVRLTPLITSPNQVTDNFIKTRNYQMILFGNILNGTPDLFPFWHSSGQFHPGAKLALYDNKELDALLEAIRRTADPADRRETLGKIQEIIRDDQPAIFLFSPQYLYAAPRALGGFTRSTVVTPADRFEDVEGWFLKTARVFR